MVDSRFRKYAPEGRLGSLIVVVDSFNCVGWPTSLPRRSVIVSVAGEFEGRSIVIVECSLEIGLGYMLKLASVLESALIVTPAARGEISFAK